MGDLSYLKTPPQGLNLPPSIKRPAAGAIPVAVAHEGPHAKTPAVALDRAHCPGDYGTQADLVRLDGMGRTTIRERPTRAPLTWFRHDTGQRGLGATPPSQRKGPTPQQAPPTCGLQIFSFVLNEALCQVSRRPSKHNPAMFSHLSDALQAAADVVAPPCPHVEDLRFHWTQLSIVCQRCQHAEGQMPAVEETHVPRYLLQMLKALVAEEREQGMVGPLSPCMEYLVQEKVLAVLASHAKADCPLGIRQHAYVFLVAVLNHLHHSHLHHAPIHKPLQAWELTVFRKAQVRRMTAGSYSKVLSGGAAGAATAMVQASCAMKASPYEAEEMEFLSTLCEKIRQDSSIILLYIQPFAMTGGQLGSCPLEDSLPPTPTHVGSTTISPTPTTPSNSSASSAEAGAQKSQPKFPLIDALLNLCHSADSIISGAAHECLVNLAGVREVWSSTTIAQHTLLPHYLATRLVTSSDAIPDNTEPALIEDIPLSNSTSTVYQDVSSITQGCLQQEGNEIEEPEALSLQKKVKVLARMDAGVSMRAICAEFDVKSSTFHATRSLCKNISETIEHFLLPPAMWQHAQRSYCLHLDTRHSRFTCTASVSPLTPTAPGAGTSLETIEHFLLPPARNEVCENSANEEGEDVGEFPGKKEIVTFLHWLTFCDKVVSVSDGSLGSSICSAVREAFLDGPLRGGLDSLDEDARSLYLALAAKIVTSVSSPMLVNAIIGWLTEDEMEGTEGNMRQLLLQQCQQPPHHLQIQALRLLQVLLEKPGSLAVQSLVLNYLCSRNYHDSSAAEHQQSSWSDEEDERYKHREGERSPDSLPISRTLAPANISKIVKSFLTLVPEELRSTTKDDFESYMADAQRQYRDVCRSCASFGWPREAVTPECPSDSSSTASRESRPEAEANTFYEGPFLSMLMDFLHHLPEQDYDINLQITSLVATLALLPHPHLHEYLLNPTLTLNGGVRTPYTVLASVVDIIHRPIVEREDYVDHLRVTRYQLLGTMEEFDFE
ncbi:Protein FAM160B1 [Chionoecetes opilio]|uniref:Protein FAM160B1 n=1 Tax=Chionoecetes opilio TaxID=41210 RepID=A0A8J4XXI8_CHIOP|nr:Protein FAM160B1 [Chionoecetes opilio]